MFFGQTHIHTSWSMDAYVIGKTVTGTAEAYEYAMGKPVKHSGGYMAKLACPLDFQGVTDHAEYVEECIPVSQRSISDLSHPRPPPARFSGNVAARTHR